MATPQNKPQGPQKPGKSGGWGGMILGFLMGLVGVYLFLLNYSNNSGLAYTGVVVGFVGVVVLCISAIRRDKSDHSRRGNGGQKA